MPIEKELKLDADAVQAYNDAFHKSIEDGLKIGYESGVIKRYLNMSQLTPLDITYYLVEGQTVDKPKAGFMDLVKLGRIDLTIEYLVVNHGALFTHQRLLNIYAISRALVDKYKG